MDVYHEQKKQPQTISEDTNEVSSEVTVISPTWLGLELLVVIFLKMFSKVQNKYLRVTFRNL